MVLHVFRALFILLMAAAGFYFIKELTPYFDTAWLAMGAAIVTGVLLVCVDILAPRKKLAIFSGTFFGLLVGCAIAYALSFVVRLLVEQFVSAEMPRQIEAIIRCVNIMLGI